jgi:hypothetical protein
VSECRRQRHSPDTSTDTVPAITAVFFVDGQLLPVTQEDADSSPVASANSFQDQISNQLDTSCLGLGEKSPG